MVCHVWIAHFIKNNQLASDFIPMSVLPAEVRAKLLWNTARLKLQDLLTQCSKPVFYPQSILNDAVTKVTLNTPDKSIIEIMHTSSYTYLVIRITRQDGSSSYWNRPTRTEKEGDAWYWGKHHGLLSLQNRSSDQALCHSCKRTIEELSSDDMPYV